MKTADQKRASKLVEKWVTNPPKSGVGLLVPHKTLLADIAALIGQVRSDAYNRGYDDGYGDGLSSEGL